MGGSDSAAAVNPDASDGVSALPPDASASPPTPDAAPSDTALSSASIQIVEVAVLQGVKVSLERDGVKTTARTADPVVGREGLLRVYVKPEPGLAATVVRGKLTLQSASGTTTLDASPATIVEATTDDKLESGVNFDIPAGIVDTTTKYSVLLDWGTGSARYPTGDGLDGLDTIDALDTGPALKIMLVPIAYWADGSGRLPDTSDAQVERIRNMVYRLYPTRRVDISVRSDAISYSTTVSGDYSTWQPLLDEIAATRATDAPPGDVYYVGLLRWLEDFKDYPKPGFQGICNIATDATDSSLRACATLGFGDDNSAYQVAHELGHAHGRKHSPGCDAPEPDATYPYPGGTIGVTGWQPLKKILIPSTATDFMTYCEKNWIADVTFGAIARRMNAVATTAKSIVGFAPTRYRIVHVGADGTLQPSGTLTLNEPPAEPLRTFGPVLGGKDAQMTGHFYEYDHVPGGTLLVPGG